MFLAMNQRHNIHSAGLSMVQATSCEIPIFQQVASGPPTMESCAQAKITGMLKRASLLLEHSEALATPINDGQRQGLTLLWRCLQKSENIVLLYASGAPTLSAKTLHYRYSVATDTAISGGWGWNEKKHPTKTSVSALDPSMLSAHSHHLMCVFLWTATVM